MWIDPDGLGGPFVPLPATCDAGLTRPISLVALGRGNEVDLHGAFAIEDFALELGLLVLDEPERSPAGNGVGRWSPMDCALSSSDGHYRPIAECAAPGRFAVGELNSDTGSYRMRLSDGLTLTSVPITIANQWTETRLSLTRDAAGTLRLAQGGTVLYQRATGKLPPLRLATTASGNPVGWRGADCAHVTDPWPSAPALCTCAPLACEARASVCGPVDDGCARVQDCGVCASGFDCADNACVCAPDGTEGLAAAPLVFGTSFPATFGGPDDVDRFSASPFVDKPGDVHYAVRLAGPAAGTSEVALALFPTMAGCCCTTTCTTGTQGTNESGATTCTATVPPGHADATPVVAADVSCAGFEHSDGLEVMVRPTAWDAACMPYALTLERAP